MDKRHTDDVVWSWQKDSQTRPPFAPFPAASLKPWQLDIGRPLLPFSAPRGPFHQGVGIGENNNSQGRALETNSSLTPLDLYRASSSRSLQDDEMESTSGITPWSLSSLFSDFKVPSVNNIGETQKSTSIARSVHREGTLGLYDDADHRHSGRQRVNGADTESDGEQRVPVHNVRSGCATVVGAASLQKAQNLFQAQSSQFSNSWPGEGKSLGNNTLTRGGEGGGGSVGSDQGSFTASRQQRSKLIMASGRRDEVGASGSTPVALPTFVHSNKPIIYTPIPSYAFPREGDRLKGKNKVDGRSEMNLQDHRIGAADFGKSIEGMSKSSLGMGLDVGPSRRALPEPQGLDSNIDPVRGMSKSPLGMGLDAGSSRGGLPEPQGLDSNIGPVGGDCKDLGAKRCSYWKEVNNEDAQPMDTDADPFCSVEPGDKLKIGNRQTSESDRSGQKQSRLRNSSDAADEPVPSGFIKRSRQHPIDRFWTYQGNDPEQVVSQREQANSVKTSADKLETCNWLQRWLSPNSSVLVINTDGVIKAGTLGNDPLQASTSGTGNMEEEHGREWNTYRNRWTKISSKAGVFKLSPLSAPSASAIAMIGTASTCLRPPLNQREGSNTMRPSGAKMSQDKHVQFVEPRRSS